MSHQPPDLTIKATRTVAQHKAQQRNLLLLWACLFTLVVSDGLVTEYLIARRFAWEWNPILVGIVGDSGFLALKAVGAALAILILWDISKRYHRLSLVITCCFVLVYVLIVYWNLALLFSGFAHT